MTTAGYFAKDQLKAFVERIERLEEEKKATADDIRDVYAEARGTGFDVKALRTIVKMRKQDADERREQEEVVDTYLHALGMLPLFRHADDRDRGETKVTISSGGKSVETTTGAIQRAADEIGTKRGKKAAGKLADVMSAG